MNVAGFLVKHKKIVTGSVVFLLMVAAVTIAVAVSTNSCPAGYTKGDDGECYKYKTHAKNRCNIGYEPNDSNDMCIRPVDVKHIMYGNTTSMVSTCPSDWYKRGDTCYDPYIGVTTRPDVINSFGTFDEATQWKNQNASDYHTTLVKGTEAHAWLNPPCDSIDDAVYSDFTMFDKLNEACYREQEPDRQCYSSHPTLVGEKCYNTQYECPAGYNKTNTPADSLYGICTRPSHTHAYKPCPDNTVFKDGNCIERIIYRE